MLIEKLQQMSKEQLIDLIIGYNAYIQDFDEEFQGLDRCPACVGEYIQNEYNYTDSVLVIKEYVETDEEEDERVYMVHENEIYAKSFVYDGCHKIYIVEDEDDMTNVKKLWGDDIVFHDIKELPQIWEDSCPLRFISNWKLTQTYVSQFNRASFEWR